MSILYLFSALSNVEEVGPTQIEIRNFYRGAKKEMEREADTYRSKKKNNQHTFNVSDNVIVCSGDMKNLLGRIKTININDSERRISIVPLTDDKAIKALKTLDFAPEQLGNQFKLISTTTVRNYRIKDLGNFSC